MQSNKKFLRIERMADAIHKELAKIIIKLCHDPRLDQLTITNVKLSLDLSIAKIYFTDLSKLQLDHQLEEHNIKIKQMLTVLKNAAPFLRCQLANNMSLRKVPALSFFYDENTSYGIKMAELFAKIGL